MPRSLRCQIVLSLALSLPSPLAAAEDWPCWRGPRGDGSSDETHLPLRWSATENVAWKTAIPGIGHSSPIVCRDRVFVVTAMSDGKSRGEDADRVLICLDRATGAIRWKRTVVTSPLEGKHNLNSWASSTPAADGELVYVTFLDQREMVVATYDFDGRERWCVRPGEFTSVHGYCSSPVLFKDKVIVNGDHDGEAYLVALDRKTGETLWKSPRENKTRSYCTPLIRDIDGRTQMMLSGSKCVASYDPNDGSRHWIIDGPTEQFVASLVMNKGLVFVTGGYPDHHLLAVNPNGRGNVTDSKIVWRETKGASYVPSPIACGDYFLVVCDDGIASCFEAESGRRTWMQRLGEHHSASLVTAGGLVYFLGDSGTMRVINPGSSFELIAENAIGESCFASPAVSDGQLFIRADKHLYCIGQRDAIATE